MNIRNCRWHISNLSINRYGSRNSRHNSSISQVGYPMRHTIIFNKGEYMRQIGFVNWYNSSVSTISSLIDYSP